jgi:hypothetical protein
MDHLVTKVMIIPYDVYYVKEHSKSLRCSQQYETAEDGQYNSSSSIVAAAAV